MRTLISLPHKWNAFLRHMVSIRGEIKQDFDCLFTTKEDCSHLKHYLTPCLPLLNLVLDSLKSKCLYCINILVQYLKILSNGDNSVRSRRDKKKKERKKHFEYSTVFFFLIKCLNKRIYACLIHLFISVIRPSLSNI